MDLPGTAWDPSVCLDNLSPPNWGTGAASATQGRKKFLNKLVVFLKCSKIQILNKMWMENGDTVCLFARSSEYRTITNYSLFLPPLPLQGKKPKSKVNNRSSHGTGSMLLPNGAASDCQPLPTHSEPVGASVFDVVNPTACLEEKCAALLVIIIRGDSNCPNALPFPQQLLLTRVHSIIKAGLVGGGVQEKPMTCPSLPLIFQSP